MARQLTLKVVARLDVSKIRRYAIRECKTKEIDINS